MELRGFGWRPGCAGEHSSAPAVNSDLNHLEEERLPEGIAWEGNALAVPASGQKNDGGVSHH